MSDDIKNKEDSNLPTEEVEDRINYKERELEMFKLYLEGKTSKQIGDQFGISPQRVRQIAMRGGWQDKVQQYYKRAYTKVMNNGVRNIAVKLFKILDHYVSSIEARIRENPNYYMTNDEIKELRKLMHLFLNENRLVDDKPTQNINNKVTYEVKLPPGVKSFGIDPPAETVVHLEHKEVTEDEKGIDIENIDES